MKSKFAGKRLKKSSPVLAAILPLVALSMLGNAAHAADRTSHTTLVSENASFFTPGVLDGRVEAIAVDGDTVFVGGTFTQVQMALDGEIFDQPYLFAYSKSTGAVITDFDPVLNGAVRALETTGEGTGIFVGGNFTALNGEANRKGLVKVDNAGDRILGFSARPDKRVYTLDRDGDTLYLGGNFERIGSEYREHLAAVNTETGELQANVNLDFADPITTSVITQEFPSVDILEVTSDGELMVVVGNFQTINGVSRSRLAVIELDEQAAVVSDWNTDVFDIQCPVKRFPQYIFGMDVSPDGSYFVTGTSGFRIRGNPACDTALRFNLDDLSNSDVQPAWRNYTGGDSVYEVAVADHAVYIGGHFEFLNNDLGTGNVGSRGSVARDGLAALDPLNGLPLLDWQSDRNPRGLGVFALEVEPEGLYIGDDTDFLNGFEHQKLKFLPVTTTVIERPGVATLPTSIISGNGTTLDSAAFDGVTVGASGSASIYDWSRARAAMFLGGNLFYAHEDGHIRASQRNDDGMFDIGERIDLLDLGIDPNEWSIGQMTGMFFDHEQGRVYYTVEGDTTLNWRAFTPVNPIFGDTEFEADVQADIPWNEVRGMDVIDGHIYFGHSDGALYRAQISGSSPVSGTMTMISGPQLDLRDWSYPLMAFTAASAVEFSQAAESAFEFEFAASADSNSFRTYEFPITEGELVDVRLTWDDPAAQLNVFLRDPNGNLVDSDNSANGSSPKWVTDTASVAGLYTVSVKIKQGSTAYQVSVNPDDVVPEEPAGAQFSSSGSSDDNQTRWQVFNFDVQAGDEVAAQISWADPDAEVRVFLRDETNTQVDRETNSSASSAALSATAFAAGQWSVAVRISGGSTDYDVDVSLSR